MVELLRACSQVEGKWWGVEWVYLEAGGVVVELQQLVAKAAALLTLLGAVPSTHSSLIRADRALRYSNDYAAIAIYAI